MTTTEQNKLIAEFHGGLRREQCSDTTASKMKHHEMWIPHHGICRIDTIEIGRGKTLHYHDSWDWLMPVVEKINQLDIEWTNKTKKQTMAFERFLCLPIYTAIGEVHLKAFKFIQWFNENKQP